MKLLIDLAGWVGSALILLAYALLTARKVKGSSHTYQLINIVGSSFLIINTVYYGAYPPAALNIVWLGIGLFSIFRSRAMRRHAG